MRRAFQRFYDTLGRPLLSPSRWLLVAAVVPLLLTLAWPLWQLHFEAPQYPEGLDLYVYAYTIEGGNDGADIPEINVLNHYVGMRPLDPAEFADLDFIPFAIGALVLLTLRVAAVGDVRALIDLAVLTAYFGLFSFGRFVYMLYVYGHHLDPKAPIHMEGFMPPVIGTQEVGNFFVSSFPGVGSVMIGLFALLVMVLAAWHILRGQRGTEFN